MIFYHALPLLVREMRKQVTFYKIDFDVKKKKKKNPLEQKGFFMCDNLKRR